MAEDRQPGTADEPEEPSENAGGAPTPPSPNSGWQLGGTPRTPGSQPPGGEPPNPFEALFGSMGGMGGMGGGDMNALVQQLQNAFSMLGGAGSMFGQNAPSSGSGVNWEVTKDTARKTVAALGPDPTPNAAQQRALTEAVSIAEVWLDEATSFPRVSSKVAAWSRAEWVENTMAVWRRLVEPVASHIADAMGNALSFGGDEEGGGLPGMAGMEQMLRPMLRSSGASMFGLQLGQGLGQLATEVVGATDIGLPLSEPGHVALLPTNVAAFGAGLEQSSTDVTLYLALRECARQRLFASAGWLREQMLVLVEQYAAGITIDTSALEQAVGSLDPSNLEELSATLEGGLFEPRKTPEQLATLERLETMLALVEGWVDEVVTQATAKWMPAAAAGIHWTVAWVTTSSTHPSTRASMVSKRSRVASCSGVLVGSNSPFSSFSPSSDRLLGSSWPTASSRAEVSMLIPRAYCSTSASICSRSQPAEAKRRWRAHSRRAR